ncbi:MAG: hypothetical protein J1E39_07210 [Eubacterium sp.]|nr:hypothetical protein [Eubacterium sp.]
MKKIVIGMLTAVLAVSMAACSDATLGDSTSIPESGAESSFDPTENPDYTKIDSDHFIIYYNDNWETFEQVGTDCALHFTGGDEKNTGDEAATIIGVQVMDSGGFPLSSYTDSMRKAYDGLYEVVEENGTTIAGNNAYYFKLTVPEDESGVILMQEFVVTEKYAYVFHITYAESSYNSIKPEIDKILNTFKIK